VRTTEGRPSHDHPRRVKRDISHHAPRHRCSCATPSSYAPSASRGVHHCASTCHIRSARAVSRCPAAAAEAAAQLSKVRDVAERPLARSERGAAGTSIQGYEDCAEPPRCRGTSSCEGGLAQVTMPCHPINTRMISKVYIIVTMRSSSYESLRLSCRWQLVATLAKRARLAGTSRFDSPDNNGGGQTVTARRADRSRSYESFDMCSDRRAPGSIPMTNHLVRHRVG
jgi:hypothetical protein